MKKIKQINTKMIATTALLLAVEIILQVLSFIVPGSVNINLSLIPITLGAIMYGPVVGGFLGLMNGVIVLCSPNTITVFMAFNAGATVLTCLTKTLLAGIIAGFIPKIIKNNVASSIVASVLVPLINTLLFAMFAYFFFKEPLSKQVNDQITTFAAIFTLVIGINFIFEIVLNVVIVPLLSRVLNHLNHDKIDYTKK